MTALKAAVPLFAIMKIEVPSTPLASGLALWTDANSAKVSFGSFDVSASIAIAAFNVSQICLAALSCDDDKRLTMGLTEI